jgi:hypothetical protein
MKADQMKDEKRIHISSINPKAIGVSMEYFVASCKSKKEAFDVRT